MAADLSHLRVAECDFVSAITSTNDKANVARIHMRFVTGEVKGMFGCFSHVRSSVNQRARNDAAAFFNYNGFGLGRTDVNSGCESHTCLIFRLAAGYCPPGPVTRGRAVARL